MNKHLTHLLFAAVALLAVGTLQSCSDDDNDDNRGNIVLGQGQEQVMNFNADQTSGTIHFVAADNWSASVRADERTSQGAATVEWLSLDKDLGQPGNTVIVMTLKPNTTGVTRTAYVAIESGKETRTIRVNQRATDTPEATEPDASEVMVTMTDYEPSAGGYVVDETSRMSLLFDARTGRLTKVTSVTRDDISPASKSTYSETVTLTRLVYQGSDVLAEIDETETEFPTGDNVRKSTVHNATVVDGRVTSGWWKDEDGVRVDYTMAYNADGTLANSSRGNVIMTTAWTAGNLTMLTAPNLGASMTYGDAPANSFANFSLNNLLTADIDAFEIAAGDPSAIWAVAGLTGTPSKALVTTVNETEGTDTKVYNFEYTVNTAAKTEVKVSRTDNGRDDGYTVWTVTYGSAIH